MHDDHRPDGSTLTTPNLGMNQGLHRERLGWGFLKCLRKTVPNRLLGEPATTLTKRQSMILAFTPSHINHLSTARR